MQEAAMTKGAGPESGQASRLAVAAIMIALVFAVMALIGPLLSPGGTDQSKLPPLFQVLAAR
jgi:hypothetical protein